jgi:hypothetical protein
MGERDPPVGSASVLPHGGKRCEPSPAGAAAQPLCARPDYLPPDPRHEGILRDPGFAWTGLPWPGTRLADYALLTWGPIGNGTWNRPYLRGVDPPLSLGDVARPTETITLTEGVTTQQAMRAMGEQHGEGVNSSRNHTGTTHAALSECLS